ncbi:MAG: aldo/keto reductase [Bacteroidales bacterium]|nr:aldo/keto reductase [Bacteroidales bacterium]
MRPEHTISKMTLGTVQLGLNYGIANNEGKPDEGKAFEIIDSALANGVNCLDTAAGYGDSEKVIGRYFYSGTKKRSDINIVTKFKLGQINASDVESVMMRSVEQSLKNLNTDYLDILLMHDAKEFSEFHKIVTRVFERLISDKTIKKAGASCYEFSEIKPMLENDMYKAFQIPVNILDLRITKGEGADRLINKLVFARSVFLQGLFFMNPAHLKGNLKEAGKYIIAINDIASEMNMTVTQLAVTYARSLPYIDSLVIGADNPFQVDENAKLVNSEPFTQDVLDTIDKKLKGAPEWLFMPFLWDRQKD